jgi:hypothetical protein
MSGFSSGGNLDTARPSVALVQTLDQSSGPDRRYAGLSDDELIGAMGRWAATESWAASAKLRAVVELLRRRGLAGAGLRAGLPIAWREDLTAEIMTALRLSRQGSDKLIMLAWSLAARLPRTAQALEEGIISELQARIIQDATAVLTDDAAAVADAYLAGQLADKTPGETGKLAQQAAVWADPEAAQARREAAEKYEARVSAWREPNGTMALAGFGLPAETAMMAEQAITDQAAAYKRAGMEGDADQLRARAFTDKLLGLDPLGADAAKPGLRARITLTIPYLTAAGLSDNPGEAGNFGVIDAGLARRLAAAAATAGEAAEWHLTIVHDDHKYAVAHACARPERRTTRAKASKTTAIGDVADGGTAAPGWPATADAAETAADLDTAVLTLPGGATISGKIHPVPVTACDHRYETDRHDPSPLLRHLVEVRDGTCTFKGCSTPATRCDFEHSVAWHKGGKTCACMCGARCRFDHQVKQSPGWDVVQILPGYHEWRTPSGRTYLRGPKTYPV